MDSYEATRVVYSRIQSFDPENASKIMGLLLIQDHGEKEMIRLAFGPETLVQSVILKAKKDLGLFSSTNSPSSTLSSPSPFCSSSSSSNPISISRQNSHRLSITITNPSHENTSSSSSSSNSLSSSSLPFYRQNSVNAMDDQLSPENNVGDMFWPGSPAAVHRRSSSVSDMCLSAEDQNSSGGFGWKPCLYYARGFCKNGTACRFLHGDEFSSNDDYDHHNHCHHELLRSKSVQPQRLSHCMNFLLQQQNESQRVAATAFMMGSEDLHKFGRTRLERNEFALNGCVNPASRQIYLTFPADSTFREEDVSNYFSIYGPVQDVRIPYQQKRMFGFVTFVYSETVKLILAKGNPHFVCDARVLVKPYKEKGKVHEKKQQQAQVERGDFSPCGTPTGMESRDPFDLQLGSRMYYNSQDMLWRRKLEEQAEFQQALELQSRRIMSLQLLDVKKNHHRAMSVGSPIQSPTQSPANFFSSSEISLDQNCSSPIPINVTSLDPPASVGSWRESPASRDENVNDNDKESSHDEIGDLLESLEHNLPDSPFASPTKSGEASFNNHMNVFSGHHVVVPNEANGHTLSSSPTTFSPSISNINMSTTFIPSSPTLDMASFKSFNCQLPRFTSGHGAIGMYAGTAGGTKFPVGI